MVGTVMTRTSKQSQQPWALQMDEGTFIDDKEVVSHKLSPIHNYIKELEAFYGLR